MSHKPTLPNKFAPGGKVIAPKWYKPAKAVRVQPAKPLDKPTPIKPGACVMFAPKCKTLEWAAGVRTVTGFENGMVRLGCGDVKLLALEVELTVLIEME